MNSNFDQMMVLDRKSGNHQTNLTLELSPCACFGAPLSTFMAHIWQAIECVCCCSITHQKQYQPIFVWFLGHILQKAAASSERDEMFINGYVWLGIYLIVCTETYWRWMQLWRLASHCDCWTTAILQTHAVHDTYPVDTGFPRQLHAFTCVQHTTNKKCNTLTNLSSNPINFLEENVRKIMLYNTQGQIVWGIPGCWGLKWMNLTGCNTVLGH